MDEDQNPLSVNKLSRNLGTDAPKNRGNAGKGRPLGVPNKVGSTVKQAIIDALGSAGDRVGEQYGLKGAHGYMHHLAMNDRQAFATLAGKVVPTQSEGPGPDGEIIFKWQS